MGDELFPQKNGQILTSDVDYVDVWRVRRCLGSNPSITLLNIEYGFALVVILSLGALSITCKPGSCSLAPLIRHLSKSGP